MEKRVIFKGWWLPALLVAPQLIISFMFFFYPSGQAIWNSLFLPDPFGLKTEYVGLDNFRFLLTDSYYLASFKTTIIFSTAVSVSSMAIGLYLAALADRLIKGAGVYQTLLIWPYAIAPAIAGVLWLFLFNGNIGLISYYLQGIGYDWNHTLDGDQAMFLVVLASSWGRISYNFLFFLAGLQAIPKSIIEAAAIDGASFWRRFLTIVIPLLSPITFFLLVVNIVYAFFDTFGIVHTITSGGPEQDTNILVYKVFSDGFVSQDLGSSAAQSVILLVLVGVLTVIQFKYIEKKVHY
ncbi:sn-glycerol-3-phosphate ABC transporter permease UgpA [Pelagibacteraceae bacterium]|jgi:sn-glycerol 3-phosphate transport system permease protein|nr:sn-glycerol-3-phosphate ABC transporter permease UgpA [Pelagibacteraceae bacterium]MDC0488936.1 sn-glycerol-3-phosphate ABC transporter permease UgpA [Pelagibacteraceae bacterium]MDC0511580.1 sn-glycerol-3-phosphate ABC transporter permease UgpA [Pelagibacteraceae bacterium]MDC0952425.1 sn-glycerol-3-phosphate ABC transporter permease UgpA [Pelagibacteraceae bacterium]MDC1125175.1 sn-glycerol-3-phosphate ABC transporter permease UgpA [Pelagibacteraceae bacterium]|tara:strand:+ start:966 stop:1847 length:882 start_codon:yes stop_codon:yes gene_type:complete